MKCDELKYERLGDMMPFYPRSTLVIRKQFVDAAIDELKREHHKERDEYIDWVNRLQKENAEFKAVIVELKDIDSKNRSAYYKDLAMMAKDVERHKYKRCLAMADKCVDLCHKAKDLYRWAEDENLEHYYNHKIEFFARWHKRWLTIAEKFKEAK